VAYLVDTNVLVYRFDARFPETQAAARDLLRAEVLNRASACTNAAP
jgi:predicted nucleic acid-binding protein